MCEGLDLKCLQNPHANGLVGIALVKRKLNQSTDEIFDELLRGDKCLGDGTLFLSGCLSLVSRLLVTMR